MELQKTLQLMETTTKELSGLIDQLPALALERAKAEARYEKQLGSICEKLASEGGMAANLIEKKAKSLCSDLLQERNHAQYLHEDVRVAIRSMQSIVSSWQTYCRYSESLIE